jgi:hypothetical protein
VKGGGCTPLVLASSRGNAKVSGIDCAVVHSYRGSEIGCWPCQTWLGWRFAAGADVVELASGQQLCSLFQQIF